MFHFFKKYQEQHFKKVPYDPAMEERWAKYQKEQEESKKKAEEEHKKKEEERKLHPELAKAESKPAAVSVSAPAAEKKPEMEEQKKKPEEPKKPIDEKFKRISTYNGDVLDRYTWGQGVWDVTVQVVLPPGTKPSMVR